MDPFEMAIGAIFNAPGSAAATYVSQALGGIPIRVVPSARTAMVGTVRPRTVTQGAAFDVRKSEVPSSEVGDAIVVGDAVYEIVTPPEVDTEGLTWICEVPLLDRVIRIERLGIVRNEHGDDAEDFELVAERPAARLDVSAREESGETNIDRQANAWRRSIFFVPWSEALAGMHEGDRVREGDTIYSVDAVAEIGTRSGIEITATAKTL